MAECCCGALSTRKTTLFEPTYRGAREARGGLLQAQLRKPVRFVTLVPTVSHSFQLGSERDVGTENKVPGRAWNGAAQPVPLGSTRQTLLVENEKLTTCIGFSGSRFTFWGRSLEHFHDYES